MREPRSARKRGVAIMQERSAGDEAHDLLQGHGREVQPPRLRPAGSPVRRERDGRSHAQATKRRLSIYRSGDRVIGTYSVSDWAGVLRRGTSPSGGEC